MNIQHKPSDSKGAFLAIEDNQSIGEMTYSWAGTDKFIIDHTEVDPAHNGKGIGKQLLDAVVAFAREKAVKIIPLCPFAKKMFDKNTSLQDVLN